jgi:hypothetical protein
VVGGTTAACTLTTRRWCARAGYRTRLLAVRPAWSPMREYSTSASLLAGASLEVGPTITVTPSNDPLFIATDPAVTLTDSAANRDANGYIVGQNQLPIEAQYLQFTMSIPSFAGILDSLVGLDVLTEDGSAIY